MEVSHRLAVGVLAVGVHSVTTHTQPWPSRSGIGRGHHTHTPAMEVQVRSWRSACSPQLERLVLSMRAVVEVRQGVKPGILHSRSRRGLRWLRADSGLGVRAAKPGAAGVCELENLWGETR